MHVESVNRLLARGWMAGLKVELERNDLVITGPRKAESIVEELRARKVEIVDHLQSRGCGALHIQPERWTQKDGKAYCPRCTRYMGHVMRTA